MRRLLLAALTLLAVAPAAAVAKPAVDRIPLPTGFQPEGIDIAGGQAFVGSIPSGAVYRASLKTGQGAVLVPAQPGRAAIGLKVARQQIFVAGGPTGRAFTYDRRTGAPLRDIPLASAAPFINDVAVARRSAYFTNSRAPELFAVPVRGGATARRITLTGDFTQQGPAGTNNLNGIASARGGRVLIVVQSNTGKLFTVDPRTGATRTIDLGGATVVNGDGILRKGRTLYVVQNRDNKIAVIRLARDLRSGVKTGEITAPGRFKVPTTIAYGRGALYAVNAQFGVPSPATTDYDVVRVARK